MAHSDVWDSSTPAGGDDPREGDDRLREIKAAGYERFLVGGMYWDDAAVADDDAGKICAGVQTTNLLKFYETDKTTVMAQFDDTAGTRLLTLGDGKAAVRPYTLVCDAIDVNTVTTTALGGSLTGNLVVADTNYAMGNQTVSAGGGTIDIDINVTGPATGTKWLLSCSFGYAGVTASQLVNDLEVKWMVDRTGGGSFANVPLPNGGGSNYTLLLEPNGGVNSGSAVTHLDDQATTNTTSAVYRLRFTNSDATYDCIVQRAMATVLELV